MFVPTDELTDVEKNNLSKAAFEKWWSKEDHYRSPQRLAWAAWEHQRLQCSDLIRQIMSIVKET